MTRVVTRRSLLANDALNHGLEALCALYAQEATKPLLITEKYVDQVLPVLVPASVEWSSDTHERLAREVSQGEAELFVFAFKGFSGLIRRIETVTLRIMRDVPSGTAPVPSARQYLIERRWDGERWVQRQHANSMSEKLNAAERTTGNHIDAVRRAFAEELNITASAHDIAPGRLFPVPVRLREEPLRHPPAAPGLPPPNPGQSLHWSDRYPGLVTWNILHHFYWLMPERHWRDQYSDNQTGHRFEWSDDYLPITSSRID